jgi:hypothetical protein
MQSPLHAGPIPAGQAVTSDEYITELSNATLLVTVTLHRYAMLVLSPETSTVHDLSPGELHKASVGVYNFETTKPLTPVGVQVTLYEMIVAADPSPFNPV